MPDSTLAAGTGLYVSTDGVSYTELADIDMMDPVPAPAAAKVDVTPLKPTNNTRTKKKGVLENAEWGFKQNWTAARATAMATYEASATDLYWKVTYPDDTDPDVASRKTFRGFIVSNQDEGFNDADDPILINVRVEVTSKPAFTAKS